MFGHIKWIFYATCYTWLGDDQPAEAYARELTPLRAYAGQRGEPLAGGA